MTLKKNSIICISVAISLVTIDTIIGDINASISNRPTVKKLNIAAVFGNLKIYLFKHLVAHKIFTMLNTTNWI